MNNKIGARQLSKKEVKNILPTYDKIFEQIENMRFIQSNNGIVQQNIQKTNNIGILGVRGAGKTSVLKTIIEELKKKSDKDIILPLIVPENMSSSSTLMSTILGLFKSEVEKIRESNKNNYSKNCISNNQSDVEEAYIEVIKQYTYIQKEYRDILINEFTTENEYVKKSKEIFNSDIEFINKFNEFIEKLIAEKGKDALIFIFVDDIDLSTTRCIDVIKTLLSYISNKNIVTFISGDLDTFEEALTIDFLRKEDALKDEVWKGKFLNEDVELVKRKRLLAYEYLKKAIPPIYRHNIKRWALEERGDYSIDSEESESSSFSLGDLLIETLKGDSKLGWGINKDLFKFINYKTGSEAKKENLLYTYHLFDDTSRGLNNVYNVLLGIKKEYIDQGNREIKFFDRKILIETIAASKEIFNRYREELFSNIINFGIDDQSTIIRFDNLENMLKNDKKDNKIQKDISDIEKFQLFIFVDFAAKIINYKDKNLLRTNRAYREMKRDMIHKLINKPQISGSSYILSKNNELMNAEKKVNGIKNPIKLIVSRFLIKTDLAFSLAFYRNLSMNSYEIMALQEDNSYKNQQLIEHIGDLYLTFKSSATLQNNNQVDKGNDKNSNEVIEYISKIYNEFIVEFSYIQNLISNTDLRNMIEVIYNNETFESWVPIKYRTYYETINPRRIINNFLYSILKDKIFEGGKIKPLTENMYKDWEIDDFNNYLDRHRIIYNIDKNNLWNHTMSQAVKNYIEVKINLILKEIFKSQEISIKISELTKEAYEEFTKIYKGSSSTKARKLQLSLQEKKFKDRKNIKIDEWIEIIDEIEKVALNNRIWYGQYAAQRILNQFKECAPVIEYNYDELIILLHYYGVYTIKEKKMESKYLQSKQLSEFVGIISGSQKHHEINTIDDFMEKVNGESNIERFYELFK